MILADLQIKGRKRGSSCSAEERPLSTADGRIALGRNLRPHLGDDHRHEDRPAGGNEQRLTYEPMMAPGPPAFVASDGLHRTGLVYFPAHELWMVLAKVLEKVFRRVNWRINSGFVWLSQPEKRKKLQKSPTPRKGFPLAWDPVKRRKPSGSSTPVRACSSRRAICSSRALPRRNFPPIARMTADCCGRCRCKTSRSPGP
jgi:hypothetical protein